MEVVVARELAPRDPGRASRPSAKASVNATVDEHFGKLKASVTITSSGKTITAVTLTVLEAQRPKTKN